MILKVSLACSSLISSLSMKEFYFQVQYASTKNKNQSFSFLNNHSRSGRAKNFSFIFLIIRSLFVDTKKPFRKTQANSLFSEFKPLPQKLISHFLKVSHPTLLLSFVFLNLSFGQNWFKNEKKGYFLHLCFGVFTVVF